MEKAVIQRAKFTSPGCLEYVYLSGRALGDSMINILINENMCSGRQFALMMVFVWNLWVSEGVISTNSQKILSDGLLCRQSLQCDTAEQAVLGQQVWGVMPWLCSFWRQLWQQREGAPAWLCQTWGWSLLAFLASSCAHVTLASSLSWPVLSMWWKRPISHLVYKVLNNYLWTSFPFAPYFSAKSEQRYMYLYRLLFVAMCLLLFISSTYTGV